MLVISNKIMGIAKVTRGFQITIPKDVRVIKKIGIGDNVLFSIEGDKVELLKMKKEILRDAMNLWKIKESSVDFVKKIRLESEKRRERFEI